MRELALVAAENVDDAAGSIHSRSADDRYLTAAL